MGNNDIKSLWQSQTAEKQPLSLGDVRHKAKKFQRKIWWRNGREYIVGLILLPILVRGIVTTESLFLRIGNSLLVAASLFVIYYLWTKGSSRSLPQDRVSENCLAFHRRELVRHRDLLRTVWKWYLGPFIPGILVIFAGAVAVVVDRGPSYMLRAAAGIIFVTFIFFGIGWLNKRAAKKLDEEIRALDSLSEN